ncbi:MAG TPA: hypothetical protein DD426_11285, partial [Clostridiaceae bacterium]|nr:hypothetical protein [Clostridiaceae bacterium]
PEKYSPYDIDVKTTGGFVYIDGLAENINVNTYTGNIFIIPHGLAGNFNIKANTGDSSFIKVSGKKEGKKTNEGVGYYKNMQSKKTLNIKSSRGIINIE